MPPRMPASIIAGRIQRPVSPQVASATPPPAMAPMVSWPSAPMFQTLARKPTARPTAIMISGAAFTPSSESPFRLSSGETKKLISAWNGL